MVLLIGCANLASLSLARGLSREPEVAVGMDLRVLAFALAVSVLTGLLFGLAPRCRPPRPIWPAR